MARVDSGDWERFISDLPEAHILQTSAWGELKAGFGWQPIRVITGSLGAQILFQDLPLGFKVGYIPRGPISLSGTPAENPDWVSFQEELDQLCLDQKAVFLKVEPDGWEGELKILPGFVPSNHSIQPPRTIVVDLEGSEEDILARMKSKTRYNIRLSARKGVIVSSTDDVDVFYSLLKGTSRRAEFGIHTQTYYHEAFNLFHSQGSCALFKAEYEGEPLASIMVFKRGLRSWYFYGASSRSHHDLMAPYLVQWEAMRWAKSEGCLSYDLWGVPDQEQETLESQFTKRSDHLWGVYRFKRGFGGHLFRSPGPWDKIYRSSLYRMYQIRNQLVNAGR